MNGCFPYLQQERRDYPVDDGGQKVLYVDEAQLGRDRKQPLDVLAVAWVPGELDLRPLFSQPPSQVLESQHAHTEKKTIDLSKLVHWDFSQNQ